MTIHINIGEAKTRLSQLIAAAMRGEEVVVDKNGEPQVRLVPVREGLSEDELAKRTAKRREAFGMWRKEFRDWPAVDIGPSMTDEEVEERWNRKFGPAS